jgi:DNA polymerase kappa
MLTVKIERILANKARLEKQDLSSDMRRADEYLAELEIKRDLSQAIVHIDCDAFFAAVEELDHPEYKTVPMAVGRGVITTCNYHARKFGCRSGMAAFVAKKLCPDLICLPQNFEKYTAKAQEIRSIIAEYDPRFESASIDEAYLNITSYCDEHDISTEDAIQQMRERIHQETKITVSAGIAPNAKIAKIASNRNKPNGQYFIQSDRQIIMDFMKDLPVRKVNGVGRVFERELEAIGIKTCGDIYQYRGILARLFGQKAFQFLMQCYLGLGRTEIQPAEEYERKSVGTESTFAEISDKEDVRKRLRLAAEELEKDLTRTQFRGRTLVLKIKLHTFEVLTRQTVTPKAVNLADDLYSYSLPMLVKLEKEIPNLRIRLLGLRCTHLISTKKVAIDFFGFQNKSRPSKFLDESRIVEQELNAEEEFEHAERQEMQDELNEIEQLSQGMDGADGHGSQEQSVFWDCPVCFRPQEADDRTFNAHIDFCLSKGTILEVAKTSSGTNLESFQSEAQAVQKRKSEPTASSSNSRQKRLFFS